MNRHRPAPALVFYLVSFFLTNVGVGGFTLATGLSLFQETGSARTFALLVAVEYALGFVGQLLGGSILDRVSVLGAALITNGLRTVAVLVGGLAFWFSHSDRTLVAVFLLSAFIRPLFRSASFVLVRRVCPPDRLVRLNALRFGLLQTAQLTGLAVVGLCYALLPLGAVIAVVALFFGGGTLLMAQLHRYPDLSVADDAPTTRVTIIENWRQLGRALRRTPGLVVHLCLGGFPVVFVALATVLVAPVNAYVRGGSIGILVLDGGATLGALLTIIASRRWHLSSAPAVMGATVLGALGLLLLSVSGHLILAGAAFLLLGSGAALGATALDTMMQLRGSPAILGRLAISQECASSLTAIALIPMLGPLLGVLGIGDAARIYSAIAAVYLVVVIIATLKLHDRLFGQPVEVTAAPSTMRVDVSDSSPRLENP